MAKIALSSGYSLVPEGVHVFKITDVKYKALSTSSRLTEVSRQSHVIDRLKENRDSTLHIADQPPFIIQVPEQ